MTQTRFNLLPAQRNLMRVDRPEISLDVCLYQGGYGSGKTWVGSLLGIILAWKHPGIRGLVTGKTYPLVRDTTLQMYFQHLEAMGLQVGRDVIWRATESKFIFPDWGGSEILFRTLQTPEKLKSLTLGWVHVEEMSQIDEADFQMLLSRLRQPGVGRYRLFGTSNPQRRRGWIYDTFVVPKRTPPAGIQFRRVLAPTTQNIYLPAHYVASMAHQFDPEYYRMNVLGEDADFQTGLVCHSWSDANIQDTPYRPDLPIYLSCDFNVDPMCWVLAHRYNGETHYFDELCLENATTRQAAEVLCDVYGAHPGGWVITGDASGQYRSSQGNSAQSTNYTVLRNTLSQNGVSSVVLDLKAANPAVSARVQAWNAGVCNQQGVRRVRVDPQCKWLIHNCRTLRYVTGGDHIWTPTTRQIEANPDLKFTQHVWDAASYLVERYDPIRLELPHRQSPKWVSPRFRPRSV